MPINYSKQELLKLFNSRLRLQLNNMEAQRIRLRNKTIIMGLLSFLFIFLIEMPRFLFDYFPENIELASIIVIGIIVACIYYGYRFYKDKKSYRTRYKRHILQKVFELLLPESSLAPDGHLFKTDYENCRIFTTAYNRFHGEDLVNANYKGLPFQFSELHTKNISGSGKNRREKTIFKGILFKAELPLKIRSNLVIIPDVLNKILGETFSSLLEDLNFKRDKLIKLESPQFERVFAVYGTDQIEARKVLTPSIMEKILNYNKKTHKDISISIQNGVLYMAIPFNKNLFEPRIWSSTSYSDIVEVCRTIEILTEVLNHFEHVRDKVA